MGEIASGETWVHPSKELLLWYFRTRSGKPLGMLAHPLPAILPDDPETAISRQADHGLPRGLARLSGKEDRERQARPRSAEADRREALEQAGPDDQIFISVSTVGLDISDEPFNGLEKREVRDVEIAGAMLRWSSGNRILSGYYGEKNAADIRSLAIFCDRMEVADNLRFPRTNVTIYARELVFKGIGRIDTTPVDPVGSAKSEYLTQDPDDSTKADVPAGEDGKATYKAADGRKGEPGGSIKVYAREVRYEDDPQNSAIRFISPAARASRVRPPD